jgi:hypothetical protein
MSSSLINIYFIHFFKTFKFCFIFNIFSDRENITFSLLKVIPQVKDWWDTYYEQRAIEESAIFLVSPTWNPFQDSIKEQYYLVGSYEDQYTRWTTLR